MEQDGPLHPAGALAPAMRRDQALVPPSRSARWRCSWRSTGAGGIWLWVKVVVIPFLLFCQTIGWVVHVHHIAPEIRWWPRREWNRFRGQVEGTTILWGPPGWDFFFHWIMVHLPHHVDMRIPCYRLPEAARAIADAFPDEVDERPIRVTRLPRIDQGLQAPRLRDRHLAPVPRLIATDQRRWASVVTSGMWVRPAR